MNSMSDNVKLTNCFYLGATLFQTLVPIVYHWMEGIPFATDYMLHNYLICALPIGFNYFFNLKMFQYFKMLVSQKMRCTRSVLSMMDHKFQAK